MFQGIFKSAINDANKNYIFGTGSIPIQIKSAQLATFADGTTKQQGYQVSEVNKLISTMLTGWGADGSKPKSMSNNYLELILSCDNGFVIKEKLQFPHIIAWKNDNTPYNIADVYKEFSIDNWLKADDFENPDITLVVEPTDEILTTSTATPPEATTEQSGRFYLYYRNLPVGINRIHIDFHIKTRTEPIDFDLEVIDGLSLKDAQTILASDEQAKINILLSGVKDVYNFTGAEGNFENITMFEWSALYQQIISLNPNNKFTHDLYFYIYDESELNTKITDLESKVDTVNNYSLKWLLPDTTSTDIPSAVLDVFAISEITEDLYLGILGARYNDITKCLCRINNADNSVVEEKFFDATGKKYMQVECAGLVFILYIPNLVVNSTDSFPVYTGLHINTTRRYIDLKLFKENIDELYSYTESIRTITKTFTKPGSTDISSRFSYTLLAPFKKLYINCHKVLGREDLTKYEIYLKNSETNQQTVLISNCYFDKEYLVEVTDGYDSIFLFSAGSNPDGITIDCIFRSYDNIDLKLEEMQSKLQIIQEDVSLLGGKKIVCFGDSITEHKYDFDNKGYCDWLAEYTGATVYNFGIGGTRLAQRAEPSSSPTNDITAYAGLDICNMVKAFSTRDFSIVDASALYLANNSSDNNIDIVDKMKSVTPEEIDIVTIFGGTNDYTGGSVIGELGSVDNGNIYGGVDNIINYLLTANPKLKIYIFTPIVRYYSNIRDEEHWSDNSVSENVNMLGKKLPDIADLIEQMAKYRHIPCNNWYWTLGWNQFNFSAYFPDNDGTHPHKGFSFLAQKMKSFIESNF